MIQLVKHICFFKYVYPLFSILNIQIHCYIRYKQKSPIKLWENSFAQQHISEFDDMKIDITRVI